MWEMNLKALGLHIVVNFICIIFLMVASAFANAANINVASFSSSMPVLIVFVLVYILAGLILPRQNSLWKNVSSVWLVALLGCLIGLWYYLDPNMLISVGISYAIPVIVLAPTAHADYTAWQLIEYLAACSLMPAFFLWVGIQYKHTLAGLFRRKRS